jgi:hypothetical protein
VVRTKDQSIIKVLTAVRRTLIISLSELKSLKARMSAAVAAKTIATLIATNLRAIKTIEAAIRQAIRDNPDARHKAGQLSAPGAGPVLAAELIVQARARHTHQPPGRQSGRRGSASTTIRRKEAFRQMPGRAPKDKTRPLHGRAQRHQGKAPATLRLL